MELSEPERISNHHFLCVIIDLNDKNEMKYFLHSIKLFIWGDFMWYKFSFYTFIFVWFDLIWNDINNWKKRSWYSPSPFLRLNLEAQNMCLYNLLNSPLTFAASQVICFHRLHTNMFSYYVSRSSIVRRQQWDSSSTIVPRYLLRTVLFSPLLYQHFCVLWKKIHKMCYF